MPSGLRYPVILVLEYFYMLAQTPEHEMCLTASPSRDTASAAAKLISFIIKVKIKACAGWFLSCWMEDETLSLSYDFVMNWLRFQNSLLKSVIQQGVCVCSPSDAIINLYYTDAQTPIIPPLLFFDSGLRGDHKSYFSCARQDKMSRPEAIHHVNKRVTAERLDILTCSRGELTDRRVNPQIWDSHCETSTHQKMRRSYSI